LLKEIRLRPKIEEHDLQAKIKTAKKLLEEGNKLRVVVRFYGREVIYPELGRKVLQRFIEALSEVAKATEQPVEERRTITLTLSAISTKKPTEG